MSPDLLTIEPNIKLDSIESTNTKKEECDSIGSSNVMPEAARITNVCGAMQCDMGTDKSQARNDESNNMHAQIQQIFITSQFNPYWSSLDSCQV